MKTPEYMKDYIFTKQDAGVPLNDRDQVFRLRFGRGNWRYYHTLELKLDALLAEAERWKKCISGVERPWLCWNISHDWCLVQQHLVTAVGWTPIVGYDPRVGPPRKILDHSVLVHFNEKLRLPFMHMCFVIEFAFMFAPRLAFWHSDLLCRIETMQWLDRQFRGLAGGEMAVVDRRGTIWQRISGRKPRYFELAGCVTREASLRNFEDGCGFWSAFAFHPNCPGRKEFDRRRNCYWDHSTGIKYWHERCGGLVRLLPERCLDEGHYSRQKIKGYRVYTTGDGRQSGLDLDANVSIEDACARLGICRKALVVRK